MTFHKSIASKEKRVNMPEDMVRRNRSDVNSLTIIRRGPSWVKTPIACKFHRASPSRRRCSSDGSRGPRRARRAPAS